METPKQETEESKKNLKEVKTESNDELPISQDLEKSKQDSLNLLTSYMQCFKNKNPEQLINDHRFKEMMKNHKFWDTQPMAKPTTLLLEKTGAFETKKVEDVRKEKLKLPDNFEWVEFDLTNDEHMKKIYVHLAENYVEDDDGCFRFDYSIEFLRWALMPPGYHKEMYFGVIDKTKDGLLVGFISGIPVDIKVEKNNLKTTEVNFLCVHKKYRSFAMASVLIKEVVRRSNLKKIWQGVYTSGTILPTPITQTRYYHRSLNPKKLFEAGFSYKRQNIDFKTYELLYKLPEKPTLPEGYILRHTEERDIKQVRQLLNDYLSQFTIHQEFTKPEAKHWFSHQPNVIESYVIECKGKITDFFSFYSLPSSILNNPKHKTLRAAYSYYSVNTSMSLKKLYECALIMACNSGYDVFNALDVMKNEEVFSELNFNGGDGYLNYYLYNWQLKSKVLHPSQIGFVLM